LFLNFLLLILNRNEHTELYEQSMNTGFSHVKILKKKIEEIASIYTYGWKDQSSFFIICMKFHFFISWLNNIQ